MADLIGKCRGSPSNLYFGLIKFDLRRSIQERLDERGIQIGTFFLTEDDDERGGMNRFKLDLDSVLDYVCFFFWREYRYRMQTGMEGQ